ncbi:MAG: DNA-binding transcriptional LysR family regulator [Polyangiales bacterium]|jgi:DNA-binding transcriptional LysR family regulator
MINPVWLRSFCTLVEEGHFTRTAERLHMTQSGVSQHVHKLESLLSTPLLLREGKSFTPSEAGERLYRQGRDILMSLSNLEQEVGLDPEHEGLVRIMSPGSVGLKLYPKLLDLQRQHTGLAIDYRFAPNVDIENAIVERRIDVGFMTTPSPREEVSCRSIAAEPLLLVTPAHVKDPSWQQLQRLGFIDHPDGAHHAGLLLGANYAEYQHSNLLPQRGFCNQIGLILQPVSLGLGFTVLPAHAVAAFDDPKRVRSHQLAHPVSETLYLALHRNTRPPQRVDTVVAEARRWL